MSDPVDELPRIYTFAEVAVITGKSVRQLKRTRKTFPHLNPAYGVYRMTGEQVRKLIELYTQRPEITTASDRDRARVLRERRSAPRQRAGKAA